MSCLKLQVSQVRPKANAAIDNQATGKQSCTENKTLEEIDDLRFEHGPGCMYTLGASSTSKEAFCTVDQPNPGEIEPSFSILRLLHSEMQRWRRTQDACSSLPYPGRHSSGECSPPGPGTCTGTHACGFVLCIRAAMKRRLMEQACGCSTVRGGQGLKVVVRHTKTRCLLISASGTLV